MSLQTWKSEFYKVDAYKVGPADAVAHSALKWRGLLPENLKRHKVMHVGTNVVDDATGRHFTLYSSCALCTNFSCNVCPLFLQEGLACDDTGAKGEISLWHQAIRGSEDARPMVEALNKLEANQCP